MLPDRALNDSVIAMSGKTAGVLRTVAGVVLALAVASAAFVAYRQIDRTAADRVTLAQLQPGPVDIGFAQSMALHHQQAIAMAQVLLDGRATPLLALAQSIAYTQLMELGEMRGWLRLWNQPWVPPSRSMDWMLVGDGPPDDALARYLLDCQRSPAGMAGMATDDELAQLRRLQGRERDELFLRLMLRHHEGGLPMAQFAARHARLPAVRALAAHMAVEQSEEMRRMHLTLAAMGAPPAG